MAKIKTDLYAATTIVESGDVIITDSGETYMAVSIRSRYLDIIKLSNGTLLGGIAEMTPVTEAAKILGIYDIVLSKSKDLEITIKEAK